MALGGMKTRYGFKNPSIKYFFIRLKNISCTTEDDGVLELVAGELESVEEECLISAVFQYKIFGKHAATNGYYLLRMHCIFCVI